MNAVNFFNNTNTLTTAVDNNITETFLRGAWNFVTAINGTQHSHRDDDNGIPGNPASVIIGVLCLAIVLAYCFYKARPSYHEARRTGNYGML